MKAAGFVLAGGKSSRMQRNKALLPYRGGTLAGHIAEMVRAAAGSAILIGDPRIYSELGYEVLSDIQPGRGPLSGIHAALSADRAEWNLVVACDMPRVSSDFLRRLLERARNGDADGVIPAGPSGLAEPLCAAYHRRCLPVIHRALETGVHKVMHALADVPLDIWSISESACFLNVNTRQEWISLARG